MRILQKLATLAAILSCAIVLAAQAPPSRHVVLISIDGFAADHLRNPALLLPNVRALASEGVEAESSETVFPSVTHPSHTTIVTGVEPRVHGVLSNRVTDRRTGQRFHVTNRPRLEMVKAPTLFDAARARGLSTAAFFWPETRDDPAIDVNIAEVFTTDAGGQADPSVVRPELLRELREAGVPIDTFYRLYEDEFLHGAADEALAQAAAHVIRTRRPALTAIHFLVTDKMQHDHGPDHYLAASALSTADHCVGIVRKAVADAGIADKTTIVVTADHGFTTVRSRLDVLPLFSGPELKNRVRVHAGGWTAWIETLPGFDATRDRPALDRALARAEATPGIARVVRPEGLHALGLPRYEESPYVPGQYLLIGDIDTFLTAQSPSATLVRQPLDRPSHEHGYLPDHPRMRPILILSGAGIAKGKAIGRVRHLDIAPTVAALLGLEMEGLPGRVIGEAMR